MSEPQFVEDNDEALEEALAAAKQLEGIEASEMSDMEQRVLSFLRFRPTSRRDKKT